MEVKVVMVVDWLVMEDQLIMVDKDILAVFFFTLVQLVLLLLLVVLFIIIVGDFVARSTETHSRSCLLFVEWKTILQLRDTFSQPFWSQLLLMVGWVGGSCHFNDPNIQWIDPIDVEQI